MLSKKVIWTVVQVVIFTNIHEVDALIFVFDVNTIIWNFDSWVSQYFFNLHIFLSLSRLLLVNSLITYFRYDLCPKFLSRWFTILFSACQFSFCININNTNSSIQSSFYKTINKVHFTFTVTSYSLKENTFCLVLTCHSLHFSKICCIILLINTIVPVHNDDKVWSIPYVMLTKTWA